jgi:hypothetical protein
MAGQVQEQGGAHVEQADLLPAGGGRCGELVRRTDWSGTPLGEVAGWPRSLHFAVRTVLSSRYPMLLLWGDSFTQIYNDAYAELIGDKHPAALGATSREVFPEAWEQIGPWMSDVLTTGERTAE